MQPSTSISHLALLIITGLAMVILFLGTFNPRWIFALWVKTALRLATALLFGYTILTLVLAYRAFPLSVVWALYTIKIICLGATFGLLLLFLITGEARRGLQDWQQARRGRRKPVDDATREA